jgi:hypothetical protein
MKPVAPPGFDLAFDVLMQTRERGAICPARTQRICAASPYRRFYGDSFFSKSDTRVGGSRGDRV